MRTAKRFEEFRAVHRENSQVLAVLRKALLRLVELPSPDQGGILQPPSPSGGFWPPAVKVTYRRHLTLPSYFLHCG
jgi:hypothetical protein